ncbi:MAG: type II toxin-antitoxin system RelE/ParE family toxin [Deltaproteobacteria bacterium]|nr:type II toxin-antitoxin system RelE/ParE family toxin [Deltaproteobacteria bacterium]
MSVRIVFAVEAKVQLLELDTWWRENRQAAASRVDDEVTRLVALLRKTPDIGAPYRRRGQKHVRWLHLNGTPYKLYYRHEPGADLVTIAAVWSGVRRFGPPLPR